MQKKNPKMVGSMTQDILDIFLGLPESIIYAFDRREFYRILQGQPTEKFLTCSNISKIINNFKRHGYVEIEKSLSGNESIVFTNKAKLAIVDRIATKVSAENEYCLVSFDIPERLRTNRNCFRRAIKRMGFRQVQKSLWISHRKLGDLIDLAATEYKVSDYVVYFISNNTNFESHIKTLLKE